VKGGEGRGRVENEGYICLSVVPSAMGRLLGSL